MLFRSFEPSPKDSAALSKADVVVVNGLGLEGWVDRLIKASGFKGELVVASDGVKTHTLEEDGTTVTDPHAWNSAANGALYAQNILNGLVKADPQDSAALKATGARGVIVRGNGVQVIYGPHVTIIKNEVEEILS